MKRGGKNHTPLATPLPFSTLNLQWAFPIHRATTAIQKEETNSQPSDGAAGDPMHPTGETQQATTEH